MKIRNSKGVYYLKRVTGHFIELQAPIQQILSRLAIKGFCDGKGNPQWHLFQDNNGGTGVVTPAHRLSMLGGSVQVF